MKRAIITVVGKDTIGIIAGVCTYLAENKINILDISQSVLQDYFAMIMLADIDHLNIDFSAFVDKMADLGRSCGLQIHTMHEDIFNAMHRI